MWDEFSDCGYDVMFHSVIRNNPQTVMVPLLGPGPPHPNLHIPASGHWHLSAGQRRSINVGEGSCEHGSPKGYESLLHFYTVALEGGVGEGPP